MGVDYDSVAGIGILVDEDIREKLILADLFSEEEWEEDPGECLEKVGIAFSEAGDSCYSGKDPRFYYFVEGKNLEEIINNYPILLDMLKRFGINKTIKDLIVIEDLLVW